MTAQIVEIAGRKMAVLPVDEYEQLLDIAEDKADALAAVEAERRRENGEEYLPSEMIDRILEGESALKVWRKFRELSQGDLAAKVNTTVATISRIEAGKMNPKTRMWNALADALNVSVEDIFPLS